MLVTNLLERKEELQSHKAYLPTGEEAVYLAELKSKWLRALWQHEEQYRYFNDKNLMAYMNRANDDSFLYVPPTPKDNWHSKTRRQTPREKFNALIAAILDQDLSPEIFSWDEKGQDQREAAEAAQALLMQSDYMEDAVEKRKMRAHELLKYGTCATEVSWLEVKRVQKTPTKKFDPSKMEASWTAKEEVQFEGVWTKVLPLNRVMLGDVTKYFINEQPFIWKEYVMTYDEAYNYFHSWKNWEFVSAVGDEYDTWNDTIAQVDTENSDPGDRNFVRMKVYENIWSDEYAIVLNDVLMTPPGLPMPTPDKQYSPTWTQVEPFDQAFAYGRSFFAVVHNDSVILDFLYNAMIDKARQGLEPPLITSFKNLVNKNMFAPGKISHGNIDFKNAVNHQGVTNADVEIARFVEENINKSSVSNVTQGQSAQGPQTAYEIREQQKQALKMIGLVLYSIARMERDIAEKKLSYILKHYPEMKIASLDKKSKDVIQSSKTFIARGDLGKSKGVGRQEVAFGQMPTDKKSTMALLQSMAKEEDAAAMDGERMQKFFVDPTYLRNLKYVFQIVANPSQRKSKIADAQESRDKYAIYIQNPMIDPEWTTRMLLRANQDDEEAAIKKQQPQQSPTLAQDQNQGMPGQPQLQAPPQAGVGPQAMPGMGALGGMMPAEKTMNRQAQAMNA